jgi:exodeoxyribonuclease III
MARKKSKTDRILSWNVNGLRACARKGFASWLAGSRATIVGIQEVRALGDELPDSVRRPRGFAVDFRAAERRGYSGVGLYARRAFDRIESGLGAARFDREGRLQIARFGRLVVANVYFPWISCAPSVRRPDRMARCATTAACPTSSTSTARSSSAFSGCAALDFASS